MKRHPGKFEGCDDQRLGEALYKSTMDGCNDEIGDVEGFGWYGLVKTYRNTYIVSEDSQGFFDYECFSHRDGAKAWAQLEKEYEEWCAETEEAEE